MNRPHTVTVTRAPLASELAARNALLQSLSPLSQADLAAFPASRHLSLPAGAMFLRMGDQAREVAVVLTGGLREFYLLPDGSERTRGFNLPGDFAGSLSDLLSQQAAQVNAVAEVATELLVSPWHDYAALLESSPAWQRFARVLAEQLYLRKAQREFELLALDAKSRYRLALARWPQLEQVFKQRHIASYIGVTPVYLSRLRTAASRR